MGKVSMLAAGALLASGLVTGCGSSGGSGSASSDYCKTLKSEASSLRSFTVSGATPDFSKLSDFIDKAHDLAKQAPSDIKDEWATLVDAMDKLTSALQSAGIKVEDFGQIVATGQLPDGVDQTKLAGLMSQLSSLASDKVTKATDAIRKQAKDGCKVDLASVG